MTDKPTPKRWYTYWYWWSKAKRAKYRAKQDLLPEAARLPPGYTRAFGLVLERRGEGEWVLLVRLGVFGVNVYYEVPRDPMKLWGRFMWPTPLGQREE